jgi:hypothetical protein
MAALERQLEQAVLRLDSLQTDLADAGYDSAAESVTAALEILNGIVLEESEEEI